MKPGIIASALSVGCRSPRSLFTYSQVRRRHLAYVPAGGIFDLVAAARDADRRHLLGSIVEAGTAMGGSAIMLAAAKERSRPLVCYDLFGLIPPPSEVDGPDVHRRYQEILDGRSAGLGGETYYGYREDLRGDVERSFAELGVPLGDNAVSLVQGLFEDTIPIDDHSPIALAHVDGDWYASTKVCLERIAPRVVSSGHIVIDDYGTWSGCRTAVHEFLAGSSEWHVEQQTRLHLVRD